MNVDTASRVHYDSGPNLLPLVDVVMVILLFLMMAGSFAGTEHNLVGVMPACGGSGDHPVTNDAVLLEVRVDSGRNRDDFIATAGRIQTSDANSLRVQLTRMKAQFASNATPTDKVQVVINPNHFARYQTVISVYQACLEAGFTKVGFHAAH